MKMSDFDNGNVDKDKLINKILFYLVQYNGNDNPYNGEEPKGYKPLYRKYINKFIDENFSHFKNYLSSKFNIVEKGNYNYKASSKNSESNFKIEIQKYNSKGYVFFITLSDNGISKTYNLIIEPNEEFVEIKNWSINLLNQKYLVYYNNEDINKLDRDINFFIDQKEFLENADKKNKKVSDSIKELPFHIEIYEYDKNNEYVNKENKPNFVKVIDYLLDEFDN